MNEIWKDIPGYECLYQVSDDGRVRSVSRTYTRAFKSGLRTTQRLTGRVLKPNVNTHGYPYVILRKNGKSFTREVHTLVAAAFLPAPSDKQVQIRHLDGNRKNSAAVNLSWGTASENQLDLYTYRGYHHRLTPADAREIRERLSSGETGRSLAKEFGVSKSNISEIKHRRSFAWLE